MDSPPSIDNETKERERQVRFVGLNWSEEEERSNVGVQRRKQARDRRIARKQERQENAKRFLVATMADESVTATFEYLQNMEKNGKHYELAFKAPYASAVLGAVSALFPEESKSMWRQHGAMGLIRVVLEKWDIILEEKDFLKLLKDDWIPAVKIACPPPLSPLPSAVSLGQHFKATSKKVSTPDGDASSSLAYSAESDIGKVLKHFETALRHAKILQVLKYRNMVKESVGDVELFYNFMSSELWHKYWPEKRSLEKLSDALFECDSWIKKKDMSDAKFREHLVPVLDDVVRNSQFEGTTILGAAAQNH